MRRPPFRKQANSVSLFPFLAVLICTMGALIVILVVMVHQARVQAEVIADQRVRNAEQQSQADKQLREEQEDFEWRREMLERQRSEETQQLARHRLELSHLEDHLRRLQQQGKQLVKDIAELENLGESRQQDLTAAQQELSRLRQSLMLAEKQLEQAKEEAASRPRSFAIIPYEGPHGTRRRPIYIECTSTGVILQPEGVVLAPADFEGPLIPGNPLDAALLATREYLARNGGTEKNGEPYPLLIVRPDGTIAYAAARNAMKSWEDEFGYELVDADIKLEFPPKDPALTELLQKTVHVARRRQEILAAAQPARFRNVETLSFQASQYRGGFQAVGDDGSRGSSEPHGRGFGNGQGGFGPTGGQSGAAVDASHGTSPYRENASHSADRRGNGPGGTNQDPLAGARGATTTAGASSIGGGSPGGTSSGGTSSSGTSPGGTSPSGTSPSGTSPGGAPQGGTSPGGAARGPRNATATIARPGQAQGTSSGSGAASLEPLSDSKGSNWALPNSAAGSTGFTRPIRVICAADRLLIIPDHVTAETPTVIPIRRDTRGAMDEFVSSIWKRVESWGIAGPRAYWKPVLSVDVAQGGEQTFAELQVLLRDSGLDVQRRSP